MHTRKIMLRIRVHVLGNVTRIVRVIFKKLRLHEKKKKQTHEARIVIRSVFNDGNMYYPQAFLDECLYKLAELISGKKGQMRTGGGGGQPSVDRP